MKLEKSQDFSPISWGIVESQFYKAYILPEYSLKLFQAKSALLLSDIYPIVPPTKYKQNLYFSTKQGSMDMLDNCEGMQPENEAERKIEEELEGEAERDTEGSIENKAEGFSGDKEKPNQECHRKSYVLQHYFPLQDPQSQNNINAAAAMLSASFANFVILNHLSKSKLEVNGN